MTHGWPGSVVEFLDVIGPLTDPRAHGGDPADALGLVLPHIPGYGLSGRSQDPGWGVPRIARAWAELMARLGYSRYGRVVTGDTPSPASSPSSTASTSSASTSTPSAPHPLPIRPKPPRSATTTGPDCNA